MAEEQSGQEKFSSTDTLKKRTIDYVFHLLEMVTQKEEQFSNNTYETGLSRGVRQCKSLLWKYIPEEIRQPIKELYTTLDAELMKIEASPDLNEDMKMLNKRKINDKITLQVLEFLVVVLLYSPLSVEYKSAEIFGDFNELIKVIRSKERVKLFSGEVADEELS